MHALLLAAFLTTTATGHGFQWRESAPGALDLYDGERRVLRYVHAYDASTDERRHETYKVYYEVYGPDGATPITKGAGGLYSHHRGIFLGWSKTGYLDQVRDFWHMKVVTQRHVEVLEQKAGHGGAVLETRIHWVDDAGRVVIDERRRMTVHHDDGSALLELDFHTALTSKVGDVRLDGDPEHAGFQYRASNGVAEGSDDDKATYLFHEDGIDPKTDFDLPWAAMSYGLDGRRYWVQHLNHPANPKGTVYSAYRDYGRFGAFPACDLPGDGTVELRYRIIVGTGGLPERAACAKRHAEYVGTKR